MRLVKSVAQEKVGFWCAALDAGGGRLFAGGTDFAVHVFDLPAVAPSKTGPLKGHSSYITSLAFLPASGILVSGGFDKQLLWWKPAAGAEPIRRLDAGMRVNRLAASPDGKLVAAAGSGTVGRVWDTASGSLVAELRDGHPATTRIGRPNTLYAVAISPDGKQLATGDRHGTVCVWDAASGRLAHRFAAGAFYSEAFSRDKQNSEYEWGGVRSLCLLPDGKTLAAGGMGPADQNSAGIDGPMRLEVFEVATGKSVAAFMNPAHKGMLTTLCLHPAGEYLLAGGGGGKAGDSGVGSLWVWDHRRKDKDGKPAAPAMQASEVVARDVVAGPDGKTLLSVGMFKDVTAGRVEVWELGDAKEKR